MGVFVFVLVFRFFWPKWMPRCRPGRRRLAVAVVLHSVCTQLSTSSRFGRGGGTQTSSLVVLTLDVRRTIGSSASTSPRTSLSPSLQISRSPDLQISRSPDLLAVPGCGGHRAGPWTARCATVSDVAPHHPSGLRPWVVGSRVSHCHCGAARGQATSPCVRARAHAGALTRSHARLDRLES